LKSSAQNPRIQQKPDMGLAIHCGLSLPGDVKTARRAIKKLRDTACGPGYQAVSPIVELEEEAAVIVPKSGDPHLFLKLIATFAGTLKNRAEGEGAFAPEIQKFANFGHLGAKGASRHSKMAAGLVGITKRLGQSGHV
jgi:hypothetical protein